MKRRKHSFPVSFLNAIIRLAASVLRLPEAPSRRRTYSENGVSVVKFDSESGVPPSKANYTRNTFASTVTSSLHI